MWMRLKHTTETKVKKCNWTVTRRFWRFWGHDDCCSLFRLSFNETEAVITTAFI